MKPLDSQSHSAQRKPQQRVTTESDDEDREVQSDEGSHVDVEAEQSYLDVEEDNARSLPTSGGEDDGPSRPIFSRNPSSSRRTPTSRLPQKQSKKSRRSAVFSDDEGESDEAIAHEADSGLEEDFEPSPPSDHWGKAGRGKSAKSGGARGKGKVSKEEKEITFKDERKSFPAGGSKRARQGSEEVADGPSSPDPHPNPAEVEPAAKKRKLPTIKKIKTASTSSTPVPSTKPTVEAPKDKNSGSLPPLPPNLPRKPAATAGNADLDLTNKDVYKQLFSHGTAPPRSGIRERQERLRQLDKMREEARTKRAEEARTFFDLQAQHDKITAYTKTLEARKSPAVWPNTLAAKFKADYEAAKHEGRARRPNENYQQSRHNGWTT